MAGSTAVEAQTVAGTGTGVVGQAGLTEPQIQIPTTITLRTPSLYAKSSSTSPAPATWQAPPLPWLLRTWTVTHSTLPMWRKAKNVRITYKALPRTSPPNGNEPVLLDDEVTNEPTEKTWMPQPKSIRGIDTPDPEIPGAWKWRGRGMLRFVGSHWEVLGWGEFGGVGWVVTWFEKSLFSEEGLDVYCERKEGLVGEEGKRLVAEIRRVIGEGGAGREVRVLCEGEELRGVRVDDA